MTEQTTEKKRRFRWRKATWALVIWSALMGFWLVSYVGSNDCASKGDEASRSGCETGTGIGIFIIFIVGVLGFIALSLVWLMSRSRT